MILQYSTGVYNKAVVTSLHTALSVKKSIPQSALIKLCQLHSFFYINRLKIQLFLKNLKDTNQQDPSQKQINVLNYTHSVTSDTCFTTLHKKVHYRVSKGLVYHYQKKVRHKRFLYIIHPQFWRLSSDSASTISIWDVNNNSINHEIQLTSGNSSVHSSLCTVVDK